MSGRRFTVLDLFSAAAGGWSLGLHRAGFVTVAACEIVEWRRILYSENFPHVRIYDDVRTLTAARLVSDLGFLPDIVVGSPPGQDISVANTKGRGVDGERSGLFFEAVRLVGDCRPRWFAGLAGHLRMDDGVSAWVAGTRIALGSRKGTSAASLIVEAFGDAVLPQIPEAIGRAILRTEAALNMVLAAFPDGVSDDRDAP